MNHIPLKQWLPFLRHGWIRSSSRVGFHAKQVLNSVGTKAHQKHRDQARQYVEPE
jgi:hypothetical protein